MAKTKVKAETGTALAVWNERLAAMAKESVKVQSGIGGGGNFISIRSGIMSYRKIAIPGNKMKVIVLDAMLENQHYGEAFDPNNPSSPDCYAFGYEQSEMVPHESVLKPFNPTCTGCEMKVFGSADRGKGKACGDVQRLGLIPEEDLEDLEVAEVAYLKLPYFSTLNWAAYVRELEDTYHMPPMAFITEISVVPDPKSQFRVTFEMVEKIEATPEVYDILGKRHEQTKKAIGFPYPKFDEVP